MKDILDKFSDWWNSWGEMIIIFIGSVGIYIVMSLICLLLFGVINDKKYLYCESIGASYYQAAEYATPVCMKDDGTLTPIKYETPRD
jgi:hypothetical protein